MKVKQSRPSILLQDRGGILKRICFCECKFEVSEKKPCCCGKPPKPKRSYHIGKVGSMTKEKFSLW